MTDKFPSSPAPSPILAKRFSGSYVIWQYSPWTHNNIATRTPKKLGACGLKPLPMLKSVTIITLFLIVVKGIHQGYIRNSLRKQKKMKKQIRTDKN
jgi:hypothetical protein